jgi:hypothetical protein
MHLVGYLYEDYHDARSLEHKITKGNHVCCSYKTLCHCTTVHSFALTLCTSEARNCGNIRNTSLDRQCITYTFYMHEKCIQKFIRET